MHRLFGRTEDEWFRIYPDLICFECVEDSVSRGIALKREVGLRIARRHTEAGVVIVDPENTYIDDFVLIGAGSIVHPHCFLRGMTVLGCDVTVFPFCDIEDCIISNGVDIRSSFAVGAEIGDGTTVGPFATLRAGAKIGRGCRVGDYVEIKKSLLGDGVKVAHLAYIGDAEVGDNTNVGCGTVFANYDGRIKQRTIVGKNAFIGANTNLVAPVTVGDHAYIAAGGTITEDVPTERLCIARARQVLKNRKF